MLFPICNPIDSGIKDDGRMPYFPHVRACLNLYTVGEKGWGGDVGHEVKLAKEWEWVHWHGAPIRHGDREGGPGSMCRCWLMTDPDFDATIAEILKFSRNRVLKGIFKLNNSLATPKRGKPGYDPTAKYDYIYNVCPLLNEIDFLVDGVKTDGEISFKVPMHLGIGHNEYHRKRIYRRQPHHTADNHFSGENVYAEVGWRCGACTHTYLRDRFPKGLKKHVHHDKIPPGCSKAKATRYENPICAVQKVEASGDNKAYTKTIVLF
ncbi:hypothetical protein ACHAWF_004989 [Thalassiosira exigua]